MRDLSVKGIMRRHADYFAREEIYFRGGSISVRSDITKGAGSLRERLERMARRELYEKIEDGGKERTAGFQQLWTHVTVRINLVFDEEIPDDARATLRAAWKTAIETAWSNRWRAGGQGELTCPFTFEVQWETGNHHHTVHVHHGPSQKDMTNWSTSDDGKTVAHAFGYMLGICGMWGSFEGHENDFAGTEVLQCDSSQDLPAHLLERLAEKISSEVVSASTLRIPLRPRKGHLLSGG